MEPKSVRQRAIDQRRAEGFQRNLTKRELKTLQLACSGLTRDETADTMGIQSQTVKNHITTLMQALGVSTMNEACYRLGVSSVVAKDRAAIEVAGAALVEERTAELMELRRQAERLIDWLTVQKTKLNGVPH